MAKKSKSNEGAVRAEKIAGTAQTVPVIDPVLAALFQSSLEESVVHFKKQVTEQQSETVDDDDDLAQEVSEDSDSSDDDDGASIPHDRFLSDDRGIAETTIDQSDPVSESATTSEKVRRKRKRDDEDLEGRYLERLAAENSREKKKRNGNPALGSDSESDNDQSSEEGEHDGPDPDDSADEPSDSYEVPQHETVAPSTSEAELEKAKRTVFLSNVSTSAIVSKTAKRALLDHLTSFVSELADQSPSHKIESIRFRSTAFATSAVPKRAAYAKKEIMDATTKSTNAYVVYSTVVAAREATRRLNGTVVLDRHLRVDSVAHPAPIDHRRCVFVGNLGFVDDESQVRAAEAEEIGRPRKSKPPGDVEEGLWRQFQQAGAVESVRVVRDPKTRVGKGFAYVQFKDENAVERALDFNEKRYPPLLPRALRVTRARKFSKTSNEMKPKRPTSFAASKKDNGEIYNPKPQPEAQSLAGRARKLFGKGGAARLARDDAQPAKKFLKTPEQVVFEGHRASRGQSTAAVLKSGRKGKGGKPSSHGRRRAAAFKAAGGKKNSTARR